MQRAAPDDFKELIDDAGNRILDEKGIEEEIVKFYKSLYENYDKASLRINEHDHFFDEITPVSAQVRDEVSKAITIEELYDVMKSCKNSAPGPDGIPYSIWTGLWSIAGKVLMEAWKYTLENNVLPPSHRVSFLKLIPKAGKDLKLLTNWRPISLSNCDHKAFTKVYANRLSKHVKERICENQTAYLRGRLINDNIRALRASINVVNNETDLDAVLVSLDAKKAFDSVEHSYIETCLGKFGFSTFIPIFRILYSDLRSDIIVNGKVVKGYNILRGVKQGDALSCVLFIMCVEPLLRNIEKNVVIEPIISTSLAAPLPKVYAYADDVNCFIRNNGASLQGIFNEYDRLSRLSGLQLNAEKTELMRLISPNVRRLIQPYRINYAGMQHDIESKDEIKINGLYFRQDEGQMRSRNVEAVAEKIDKQLKSWSKRNLSILGKILIVKTFGISQMIFLMQSLNVNETDYKKWNALLYKFVWNRHYLAAKAPERIKRDITNKSIKLGGLGMLDIRALDEGLKLRALGRLKGSQHPFLKLLGGKLDESDFFFPKFELKLESVLSEGVQLLRNDRQKLWGKESVESNGGYLAALKQIKLTNAVSATGKNSLAYFALRLRGKSKLSELNVAELTSIRRFVPTNLAETIDRVAPLLRLVLPIFPNDSIMYYNGSTFVNLAGLSSKGIREVRQENVPICLMKIGLVLTPNEALNLFNTVNKLTCTRSKDILLRLIHGELYSKDRLYRYQLTDTPECPRCNLRETLVHKFIECDYVKEIWRRTLQLTNKLRINNGNETLLEKIMSSSEPNLGILTVHAEVLSRIRSLDPEANVLTLPIIIAKNAIARVRRRERNQVIKGALENLLQ